MLRYAFLGLLFSTLSFSADIFNHDLKKVPRTGDCNDKATSLAESFHKKTGLEIYWAGSLKESKSSCDIRISYIANTPFEFTSSVDKGISASLLKGTHRTLTQCEADLAREVEVFERATQLTSWISYCYVEDQLLEPYPFVPFVEGIGKGEMQLFGADKIISVKPRAGWASVEAEIENNLHRLQLVPASIRIRPYISAVDKELTVRFYGKERFWLSSVRLAKHTDPKTCEAQVKNVQSALMKADIPPVSVYCGEHFKKDYWLNLIGLSTNIFGVGRIKGVLDPQKFPNLTQCVTAGPDKLSFYEEKLGKKSLAFICTDAADAFQATVFIETNEK